MRSIARRSIPRATSLIAVVLAAFSFASAQTFVIKAKSTAGGTISPSGSVTVQAGADQTFTISPNTGFSITKVVANRVDLGAVTSYTFVNVQKKGAIKAAFKIQSFPVTFSASSGVRISPSGTKTFKYGKLVKVSVTPPAGSTATHLKLGFFALMTSPTPVIVPPVPTPATMASTRPSVSCQISTAVV